MRLKPAHALAAGLVLALSGWLLSGQLGVRQPERPGRGAARRWRGPRQLPAVRVRSVRAAPVAREIVINGKTAPARAVELRAETDGRVIGLGARRGAAVEAGRSPGAARSARAPGDGRAGPGGLTMRQIEHDAAEKLGQKGFQAETKVAEASANLEAAQAALERSQLELAHTEIRAPFDGVLEERPVEIGDYVDTGDPVATVIEQDPFLVIGEAAETEIGRLRAGMAGTARLITGARRRGPAALRRRARRPGDPDLPGRARGRQTRAAASSPGSAPSSRSCYDEVAAHRLSPGLLTLNDDGRDRHQGGRRRGHRGVPPGDRGPGRAAMRSGSPVCRSGCA